MRTPLSAFFQPAPGGGQRLYLHHTPPVGVPVRCAVLYLHPWAEEMNKSRRMIALQARALAAAGAAVLQIDLHGCGDSSDDLAQASWDGWQADALQAARWLREKHPDAPLWIWGLRAGCLLAAATTNQLGDGEEAAGLMLWQPPAAGRPLLQQFLRLLAAAGMQQGDSKLAVESARRDLAAGGCVVVAGYVLPPSLAGGLERAALDPPRRPLSTLWLEVSGREEPELLPASLPRIKTWRAAGHAVTALAVRGPAFWQTQEIEDAPALIDATLAALCATWDR